MAERTSFLEDLFYVTVKEKTPPRNPPARQYVEYRIDLGPHEGDDFDHLEGKNWRLAKRYATGDYPNVWRVTREVYEEDWRRHVLVEDNVLFERRCDCRECSKDRHFYGSTFRR